MSRPLAELTEDNAGACADRLQIGRSCNGPLGVLDDEVHLAGDEPTPVGQTCHCRRSSTRATTDTRPFWPREVSDGRSTVSAVGLCSQSRPPTVTRDDPDALGQARQSTWSLLSEPLLSVAPTTPLQQAP